MSKVSATKPPTPPASVLSLDDSRHDYEYVTVSSTSSGAGALHDLKPYNEYLPPAKRSALAAKEFELQMAERELRLKTLDKEMQKFTAPRLRKYTLPFALTDAQLAMATSRFPRTIFKCGLDSGHDHPMAHLETMVASDRAAFMIPAGHTVYDIYGSPKRVAALNAQQTRSNNPKRFVAYVKLSTEKDYIRSLDWENHPRYVGTDLVKDFSPLYLVQDSPECVEDLPCPPKLTTFLFIHTLYYVSDEDLIQLLSVEGSRAVAVVLRHQYDSGKLFDGEATYAKIGDTVEQVNCATGERYVHRDLSFLFTSRSKVRRVGEGAYVWTLHKVSDETWIVVLTACDAHMDERFTKRAKATTTREAAVEMNSHDLQPTKFIHPELASLPLATCRLVGGVALVSVGGTDLRNVRLTCPPLLKFLRIHISGKPRDATRLQDLFALARLHTSDGSEFAGKHNFKVEPDDIAGHVVLAFLSELKSESVLLRAYSAYRLWSREHRALLDGNGYVHDGSAEGVVQGAVRFLSSVNNVRKGSDVVSGVLDAVT